MFSPVEVDQGRRDLPSAARELVEEGKKQMENWRSNHGHLEIFVDPSSHGWKGPAEVERGRRWAKGIGERQTDKQGESDD